ncbi:MAG: class I SAM-dependent methyltransferase [candidate division Zixibacteria bacterium]|nr:class I SAM-dependent methyltransferase [candidate division Zixibacteria bacterium]
MNDDLYSKPRYYHLAFQEAYKYEKRTIKDCFSRHVSFPVKRVMEVACGTGRMLVALPPLGYHVTGYDLSTEMVEYSIERTRKAELEESVIVVQGDMASITFDDKFDAAINLINSIGYLHSDEDILSHLRNTADALNSGGVYLVCLGCGDDEPGSGSWPIKGNNVKGTATWGVTKSDTEKKLSYQYFQMEVVDNSTEVSFRDEHILRLWSYDDFKRLVKESGRFVLEAIYDEGGKPVPPETNITSETGNLFYVLKVR